MSTSSSSSNAGPSQRHQAPTLSVEQQQHQSSWSYQSTVPLAGGPSHNDVDDEEEEAFFWRFTDFDHTPEKSRDGSIYATNEVFNAGSHLAASCMSFLGSVLLIAEASAQGAPWKIVSFSIYGTSLVFLFVCSTLHHSITSTKKFEQHLRMLDYLAIYPLIAGTFTPLCFIFYHNSIVGWTFGMVVWFLAVLGMILTWNYFEKIPKWFSTTLYVTLGWLGACMTYWLLPKLGYDGLCWLVGGGIFYTIGGYIFSTECVGIIIPNYFGFHEIWHIFVMLGATCHYYMMYKYVLSYDPNHY